MQVKEERNYKLEFHSRIVPEQIKNAATFVTASATVHRRGVTYGCRASTTRRGERIIREKRSEFVSTSPIETEKHI